MDEADFRKKYSNVPGDYDRDVKEELIQYCVDIEKSILSEWLISNEWLSPRLPKDQRAFMFAESRSIKSGVSLCISYVRKVWVICVKQIRNDELATGPVIRALCERHGFKILGNQTNPNISTDNLVTDYVKLYGLIASCDELANAEGVGWKKVESPNLLYSDIARIGKVATDSGNTRLLSRVFFDVSDSLITINKQSKRRTYREHLVPCDLLLKHMVKMYEDKSSVFEVTEILENNLKIAYIDPVGAKRLDTELGLKTTMPPGWNFGDPITARLDYANIDY